METGNGCWLLDLAQGVPAEWSFEDCDVSPKQYSAKAIVHNNVSAQDAIKGGSEQIQGNFDVVHIRAFAGIYGLLDDGA